MKATRFGGILDHQTFGRFEVVRKTLQDERYADRLEKPLAYWALPNDRQLPIALLRRTVGDLLATPIDKLTETPGIGQKKIRTFVTLLERASDDRPPEVFSVHSHPFSHHHHNGAANGHAPSSDDLDPANVSEATWSQWQQNIETFKLGSETLGRLAPSLQSLPTVIWQTPLNAYLDQTLEEIRGLKTHGEKRVRGVVEVFYQINKMLAGMSADDCLAVRLKPKFAVGIEDWIALSESQGHWPSVEEVTQRLAEPLVQQVLVDAGQLNYDLSRARLGIEYGPRPVRELAREKGMTRARVYQIFDDCAKIMSVRWPEGQSHLGRFRQYLECHPTSDLQLAVIDGVRDFFFPAKPEEE